MSCAALIAADSLGPLAVTLLPRYEIVALMKDGNLIVDTFTIALAPDLKVKVTCLFMVGLSFVRAVFPFRFYTDYYTTLVSNVGQIVLRLN